MRASWQTGAWLLLLAGAIGIGCNSLVGNDTHELDPSAGAAGKTGHAGQAGTGTGGGLGPAGGNSVPAGGANGGGTVATGGVPAAGGGPGAGGGAGGSGAATGSGGRIANGGSSGGGHVGSGGAVASGGASAGGTVGSGGVIGSGGAVGSGGAGGMCMAPGGACTTAADCCQTSSTTQMGAECIKDDGVCHAKCMNNSNCAQNCCVPVSMQTYGVCADPAIYCSGTKGVGDPCVTDGQCQSGTCNGWCVASCAPGNAVCPSTSTNIKNSNGQYNWCVFTSQSVYSCFPGCSFDSDCTVYGPGLTCKAATDADQLSIAVCASTGT